MVQSPKLTISELKVPVLLGFATNVFDRPY